MGEMAEHYSFHGRPYGSTIFGLSANVDNDTDMQALLQSIILVALPRVNKSAA